MPPNEGREVRDVWDQSGLDCREAADGREEDDVAAKWVLSRGISTCGEEEGEDGTILAGTGPAGLHAGQKRREAVLRA
jgi:hypothetical protein